MFPSPVRPHSPGHRTHPSIDVFLSPDRPPCVRHRTRPSIDVFGSLGSRTPLTWTTPATRCASRVTPAPSLALAAAVRTCDRLSCHWHPTGLARSHRPTAAASALRGAANQNRSRSPFEGVETIETYAEQRR